MTVLRKLVSPAGFVLALLFFLLPVVAVSCDAGGGSRVETSYSGLDLVTGNSPPVEATGGLRAERGGPFHDGDTAPDPDVQVLAILIAALLAAGIATSLIRPELVRLLAAVAAAVAAGALLVITEIVAKSHLKPLVRNAVESQFPGLATDNLDTMLDDVLRTGVGYWLVLVTLVLVVMFNIGVAVRSWVRQ